ncbi:hypothetical protein ACI79D_07710 [Geodermatophilus sp. SYSU D00708]
MPAYAEEAAGPRTQCQVTDPRLPELSGLAVVGNRMLAIDDGGDRVDVYVLDATCLVIDVRSAAVDPYDPEDLAVAADGTVWLADTGDNNGTRETVALIALRPDDTTEVYRLAFPEGRRDVEALLLAPDGTPYLVSKEVLGASKVYRPVSALVDAGTVGLTEVAGVEFTLTGTPGGPVGRAGQLMVTGGAVSPDGRFVALRTYTDAYVWPLSGSDVAGALAADPVRLPLPESPQGEAISFTADTTGLVVSSEGLPADVTVVPLSAVPSPAAASGSADGSVPDLLSTDDGGATVIAAGVLAAVVAAALVWIVGRLRRRS